MCGNLHGRQLERDIQGAELIHSISNKTIRALIVEEGDEELGVDDAELKTAEIEIEVVTIINEAHFALMDLPFYSVGGISSPNP